MFLLYSMASLLTAAEVAIEFALIRVETPAVDLRVLLAGRRRNFPGQAFKTAGGWRVA